MDSVLRGHTQSNIDLLKVLSFVQETMQTLSDYKEQLQRHLDINLTQILTQIYQNTRFLLVHISY